MKNKKILKSFKYAFNGIITSFKTEKNMKFHIVMMVLVIIAGTLLKISKIEWIICVILFALVISAELINTAIETNEKAKIAKDVAAGAVLVNAIGSTIIGLIIFIPKIINIL